MFAHLPLFLFFVWACKKKSFNTFDVYINPVSLDITLFC